MKSLIELKATEKIMAILGLCIFVISLLLGYRLYALGVALAASISWLFYRWQIITVANGAGLPPRKAANRLIAGSIIRLVVLLILLAYLPWAEKLFCSGY